MIYLVIYTAENCPTCHRVVRSAKEITNNAKNVELSVKDIKECTRKISIVPAVFINQSLFCYGDINTNKLAEYIKRETTSRSS